MSIVGFDIGNDTSAVAVVKAKSVVVLLNNESKYETPSVVSFAESKRHFGFQALSSATRNPAATISQIKRIIGKPYRWPGMEEQLRDFPYSTKEANDGGILICVQHAGKDIEFTPVQIMSMFMSSLRKMVETNACMPPSHSVFGLPSCFTDSERIAYLDALEVAGFDRSNVRLMHEGTAIALGYGIYKPEMKDGTVVVFVDVGHCHTQVTVVRFSQQKMEVVCHATDSNLGGRDFDRVLFGYFTNQFPNVHVGNYNVKMRARLMAECEKAKKVLSSNMEARINIECFSDEWDFSGVITRKEFDQHSSPLLHRITATCENALYESGLDVSDVFSVELVGSGSRIPAISDHLSDLFKKNLSRTLNASECVARGCALQGYMLAKKSSVRIYKVEDCVPSTIEFSSQPSAICVFLKGQPLPNKQQFSFSNIEGFDLNMVRRHFKIGSLKPTKSHQIPVLQLDISLNEDGIVIVSSSNSRISDHSGLRISEDALVKAKERENQLASKDNEIEETQRMRNSLEAYAYEMRKKLSERYKGFTSDSEKENILKCMDHFDDWLSEDVDDKTQEVYSDKLNELKKVFAPIENRYKSNEDIIQAIKGFSHYIIKKQTSAISWPTHKKNLVDIKCEETSQLSCALRDLHDIIPKNNDQVFPFILSFTKQWENSLNESYDCIERDGTCSVPMPETRVTDLYGYLDKTAQENVVDDFIFKIVEDINKCNKASGTLISKRNDNCMLNSTPLKTKSTKYKKRMQKSGHTKKQKEENLIPKANKTAVIDKILERYGSVATDSEKGKIMEAVKQIMQCHSNFDKLKMLLFPIELRFHDEKTGSGTVQDLVFCIFQHKVEKIVRISSEKLALVDCCNVEKWLKEKLLLADKSPKDTISVPDSAEIMQKMDELTRSCQMSLHEHQAAKDFQKLETVEQSLRSDIQVCNIDDEKTEQIIREKSTDADLKSAENLSEKPKNQLCGDLTEL